MTSAVPKVTTANRPITHRSRLERLFKTSPTFGRIDFVLAAAWRVSSRFGIEQPFCMAFQGPQVPIRRILYSDGNGRECQKNPGLKSSP
jgi:hypothetical protein